MAICAQCGGTLKDDAKFCGTCGATAGAAPATPEIAQTMDMNRAALPAAPPPAPAAPPPVQPAAPPPVPPAPAAKAATTPPPPPIPPANAPAAKAVAAPPAAPPASNAPAPKKKGCSMVTILIILAVIAVMFIGATLGVYFLYKKAKSKAQDKLAQMKQQIEQSMPKESSEPPASEATPPAQEPPAASESAPTEATPAPAPTEESAHPAPRAVHPAPPPSAPAPSHNPGASSEPAPASPAPAPRTETPAEPSAPAVHGTSFPKAILGVILESEAPGSHMVVKVDGTKVFEQDLPPLNGGKVRLSKEIPVSSGQHHIRVAIWRPGKEPVAGEWDFDFAPDAHPVFRVDVNSNWKMEYKRFQ